MLGIRGRKINRKKNQFCEQLHLSSYSDSFSVLVLSLHKRCLFQPFHLQAGLPSLMDLDVQSEDRTVIPRQPDALFKLEFPERKEVSENATERAVPEEIHTGHRNL